jgi:hypothetical protein
MSTYNLNATWNPLHKFTIAGLLFLQFAVAYVIGTGELLVNDRLSPLAPIATTAIIPVTLFLVAYRISAAFREIVLSWDIRTLTMMQQWRVMGFGFLLLYAHNTLPALFAWPAGVGDVAVGVAALFVVAGLNRSRAYATSRRFVWFNIMGLLDFAAAIATAGLSAGAYQGLVPGGITSAPMDVWPLNLFPSFLVPFFIILHISVLLKIRHLRKQD